MQVSSFNGVNIETNASVIVIIVNWNTKQLLRQCLESLRLCRCNVRFYAVVVDNDSTDGSAEMVETEYPECKLVKSWENIGFGRANNLAFRLFPGYSYYLLLNSDAMITPSVMCALVRFLEEHPEVGAAGPALKLPGEQYQMGGAGWGPNAVHAFNTFLMLSNVSRRFRGLFIVQKHYAGKREAVMVDWLAGACMMVRSQTLADIGLFDERYFVYGEDAEWCWRARSRGWKISYLPYVSATHYYRGSMATDDWGNTDWYCNMLDAVRRTSGDINYRLFLLCGVMGYLIRFVVLVPFSLTGRNLPRRARLNRYVSLLKNSLRLLFPVTLVERNVRP